VFSRVISLGDLLTFVGAALLGVGVWSFIGAWILIAYGAVLMAIGLWLSWRNRPRRKP
jgi:hypothetical protein